MSDLLRLTGAQKARSRPCVPKSHGKPLVEDRCGLSRIVSINRNGVRWSHAAKACGPSWTFYTRWKR